MKSRQEGMTVSRDKTPMSGAKGFVVILGSMFGIMAALWVIAALAAPP